MMRNWRCLGTQATPETYKRWKIRADATMLTSDNAARQNSSPAESLYLFKTWYPTLRYHFSF